VLVTGPTGSGKSTTLAAMIDSINRREQGHIITMEDPIEYAFVSNKSAIEQREVGADVPTFASGLRHALRQDPDVILVGEMRDLETTSAAITAAETGHLVFSTLHTVNAPQTIERIIDIYPSEEQNQIRSMLANTLQAVISQTLFRRSDQPGMIPGVEIMLCTPAVRNCIREKPDLRDPEHHRDQPGARDAELGRLDQADVHQRVHFAGGRGRPGRVPGEAGAGAGAPEEKD
jgi:twitching motility protein PilT